MPAAPLTDLCFAVIDVETTGLSPQIENVIEVGICVHRHGREQRSFSSLVGPAVPVPWFITKLTGLRERDLATAPLFADIVLPIARCFEGVDFVVAHNVGFDRAFVDVAFTECRRDLPPLVWIDPVPLARQHLGFAKLTKVAAHYGVDAGRSHRALDDARTTATILYRLAREMNLRTVAELQRGAPIPPKPTTSTTPATTTTSDAPPAVAQARLKPFV